MERTEKLKADVKDLLNQIVIKLKDIKELEIETDDEGIVGLGGWNLPKEERPSSDDQFLFSVRELAKMSLERDMSPVRALEKYYTSTCY